MKVFISLPHHGRTEDEILKELNERFEAIKKDENIENPDGTFELIDTVHNKNVPDKPSRLWYLGEAIKKLDEADLVYFAGDWYKAKGCWVEFIAAELYDKNTTYDYDTPIQISWIHNILGTIQANRNLKIKEDN